jgi:hypothetical protein
VEKKYRLPAKPPDINLFRTDMRNILQQSSSRAKSNRAVETAAKYINFAEKKSLKSESAERQELLKTEERFSSFQIEIVGHSGNMTKHNIRFRVEYKSSSSRQNIKIKIPRLKLLTETALKVSK